VRLDKYHKYLEKFDRDLINASRAKEPKEIRLLFKERLLMLFMLFRRYIIDTKNPFTEDDIGIMQTIHMTYTIEDYLRMLVE